MAKRPTRLRFTEDDLADSHVKKAADRADKAVDKAEKAADKLASKKAKPKLKLETDAAGSRKAKLRFEKAEFTEIERPSVAKHMASRGAAVTLTSKAHQAVSEYEDDNIGVQAVLTECLIRFQSSFMIKKSLISWPFGIFHSPAAFHIIENGSRCMHGRGRDVGSG